MLRVLDLFSGIGGFSLGLERAGMKTAAFCESNAYCRAVLRKHWPDVPCFTNIRDIDAAGIAQLGRVDLICGGFPCQPFSVAGIRRGGADSRNLWPEMFRVVSLARPTWVIGENVTGFITLELDNMLADLESIGYAARPFVIPACGVGAPHLRNRVWVIAVSDANGGRCGGQREPQPSGLESASRRLAHRLRSLRKLQHAALTAHTSGARFPIPEQQELFTERRREEGRTAAQCNWWGVESGLGRVAYGISGRVDRLRALGNAVVPQIVETIGRAIMTVDNGP